MAFKETFSISGDELLKKIKELIAEGNVSKISISDKHGVEIISFPVTIGVVGVIVAPILAAVGTVAALLTECKITVERRTTPSEDDVRNSEQDDNPAS